MRIIVIPNEPYDTMAGRHYLISRSLAAQGHEVHSLTWDLPYQMNLKQLVRHFFSSLSTKEHRYEDFTVHRIGRLPYYWPVVNGWLFKYQLRKIYRRTTTDIIFTESYTNETEVPKDLPFIYDLADDYAAPADVYGSSVYKLAFKLLQVRTVMRRQCQNALAVTAVSRLLEDYAKQYSNNVILLPNGVNKELSLTILAARASNRINPHSVVYGTRFGQWSRAIETIQAVMDLKKDYPKLELTLVGDGTESSKMLDFIESNGIEDYVHFMGFVQNQKKYLKLLSQNAIGLNISDRNKWRDAAHPIKVLEYSALGMKVISTDLAEVKRLGFPNIYLLTDTEGGTLVEVLRQALDDKTNFYKSVSDHVLSNYSWGSLTKQIESISSSVLAKYRAKKVIHISPSYPPMVGGLETVVQALAKEELNAGLKVSVITSTQKSEGQLPKEVFTVRRLRSFDFANTTIAPGLLLSLLRNVKQNDVVHLHITRAYFPEVAYLASRLKRFSYIAHIHLDVPPSGIFGVFLGAYKSTILKVVLSNAKFVVVPTRDYKYLVVDKYNIPRQRVVVVANASSHKIISEPKKSSHSRLRLLFVGRLSYQKNLSFLLDSLATYYETYNKNFLLSIVGAGDQRKLLQRQVVKQGLSGVVNFAGQLSGEKLEEAYAMADIFLLSSTSESFGLVLVEAMSKGLPLISTNIPAVRDVVKNGRNGLLVDQSINDFSDAIHLLAKDDKLYHQISANNLNDAKDYSWGKSCKQFMNLYERSL